MFPLVAEDEPPSGCALTGFGPCVRERDSPSHGRPPASGCVPQMQWGSPQSWRQ